MPDPTPTEAALAAVVERASVAYAEGINALTTLVLHAHHITASSRGQDLRPVVIAYANIGLALFPEGSQPYQTAIRLRDMVRGESVAKPAKERQSENP